MIRYYASFLRFTLFFPFLCIVSFHAWSQAMTRLVKSSNINSHSGLVSNTVTSIVQDNQGFIWFGTEHGICRYDGRKFRNYDGFVKFRTGENVINSLMLDSKGFIWIATYFGLYKFNTKTCQFRSFINQKSDNTSLSENKVKYVYEDKSGVIWAGTDNGLNKLVDDEHSKFDRYLYNQNSFLNYITGITQDSRNSFWVSTEDGLVNLSSSGKILGTYTCQETRSSAGKQNRLSCLMSDGNIIWVGSRTGSVKKFDIANKTFTDVILPESSELSSYNEINCIKKDKKGTVWIGSFKGLYNINAQTNEALHYLNDPDDDKSISANAVLSLMEDKDGAMWVGTYMSGADIFRKYRNQFKMLRESRSSAGLSNNMVNAAVTDRYDNLWIGTNGGGLNLKLRNSKTIKSYTERSVGSNFGTDQVSSIFPTSDDKIWVGMYRGGISVYDPINEKWKPYRKKLSDTLSINSDDVYHILEDSKKRVWISAALGLDRISQENGAVTHVYFEKRHKHFVVSSTYEDSKHNIWVSSLRGIYVQKNNSSKFEQIPITNGAKKISRNEIYTYCVIEDNSGNIWAGTSGSGLLKYNTNRNVFEPFLIPDLLPNEGINTMQVDNLGRLWLSSRQNLMLLYNTKKRPAIYGKADGIFADDFIYNSSGKGRGDGMLYFGTGEGLLYFNADDIVVNEKIPKLVFTDLEVHNKRIEPGDSTGILESDLSVTKEIVLSHEDNFIKIGFASLNYIQSEKNRFSYSLKGTNDQWHIIEDPSVTFNNLAPGNYTLLVKGSNNDNVWSEHPASLNITVLQPFWKRWWAVAFYAIVILLIIYLVVRFLFARREIQRNEELQQSKLDFFTNISHEIRTHLSLISGPVDKLVNIYTTDDDVRSYLTLIQNNSKRLVGLVTELLDFRKIDDNQITLTVNKYDLVFFAKNILSVFEYLRQQKNITVILTSNKESIIAWFDYFQLEKVFYNLISNAFKFIDGGSKIEIEIREEESDILIKITDDGRGIKEDSLNKIFNNYFQVYDYGDQNTGYGLGLALSKKIVELHHGTIKVESTSTTDAPTQTIFSVTLLKGKKHFERDYVIWSDQEIEPNHELYEQELRMEYENEGNDQFVNEKPSILIAEDNPELRKFLTQCLAEEYNIIDCSDGSEAWDKAIELIPDIVVSDIMMGEVSGLDLCRRLKTDERTSHIPVILLTAMASKNNRMAGLMHEADQYITKPFDIKELELVIANLLNLRKAIHARFGNSISQPGVPTFKPAGREEAFLLRLTGVIEENMSDDAFDVIQLSRSIGISRPVLYRKVKAITGMSIIEFSKNLRLKKAAEMLSNDSHNIIEISELVGFSDRRYFSREFRKVYGRSPSEYSRSVKAGGL